MIDDIIIDMYTWLAADTDMAALTNFGHTFSEEAIAQEDLDTQHLLHLFRPYELTDSVFD